MDYSITTPPQGFGRQPCRSETHYYPTRRPVHTSMLPLAHPVDSRYLQSLAAGKTIILQGSSCSTVDVPVHLEILTEACSVRKANAFSIGRLSTFVLLGSDFELASWNPSSSGFVIHPNHKTRLRHATKQAFAPKVKPCTPNFDRTPGMPSSIHRTHMTLLSFLLLNTFLHPS